MNRVTLQQDAEARQKAGQPIDDASVASAAPNGERPAICYATDAEVDEAMKKVFAWHGPLLKKLAE